MQLSLEKTFILDTRYETPKHFIIIGGGGNGGYYLPQLARQVSIQNKLRNIQRLAPHKITIVDADDVEDKNLNRQNFISRDINMNKAHVLADRYGRAFGLEIDYIDEYLTSTEMLAKIINGYGGMMPVLVGAVDNNKTRKILHDVFKSRSNIFYLDAGNEEWAGQVVCGFNYTKDSKPILAEKAPHCFNLPSICDLYPEVLEAQDKLPTEMSCAERSESAPQNIFTNQTAATLMLGFTNAILTANRAEGTGLKQHAVIFDAENMNFTTKFNRMSVLYPEPEPTPEPVAEVKAKPKAKKAAPKKKAVKQEQPVAEQTSNEEEVPF